MHYATGIVITVFIHTCFLWYFHILFRYSATQPCELKFSVSVSTGSVSNRWTSCFLWD